MGLRILPSIDPTGSVSAEGVETGVLKAAAAPEGTIGDDWPVIAA